jgi:UDP-glucose 4-epimerase
MRVFVTGAAGFLGSYLVEELINRGHDVAVLLREQTNPWRLDKVRTRICVIIGAMEDSFSLRGPLSGFAPEAVAHFAWRGVANSERNSPAQAHNIAATVELADLAADLGARVFVGAGSHAEYGPYSRMIHEDDRPSPTTLYGMAKLAAGMLVGRIASERDMRFAWGRIFSTYGPRDNEYWLIPSLIRALAAREKMALTACAQRWGFLHARDAAVAFRILLETDRAAGIYNIGSPDAPTLRSSVTMLRDLVNPDVSLAIGELPYRPDQVMFLQPDVSRLHKLGWAPRIDLATGLREMVSDVLSTRA